MTRVLYRLSDVWEGLLTGSMKYSTINSMESLSEAWCCSVCGVHIQWSSVRLFMVHRFTAITPPSSFTHSHCILNSHLLSTITLYSILLFWCKNPQTASRALMHSPFFYFFPICSCPLWSVVILHYSQCAMLILQNGCLLHPLLIYCMCRKLL